MSQSFTIEAEQRSDLGKGASRRLRRADRLPAVVYGANKEPVALTLDHTQMTTALKHESFYSSIITLDVAGKAEKVVLKDLQRHPYKPKLVHADFLRISDNEKVVVHVPLHFIDQDKAPGIKMSGGLATHLKNEVEVSCLPKHLPEFIEVDMSKLEVGQTIHLSDLVLPEGVSLPHVAAGNDHDVAVANILAPKGGAGDEDTETSTEDSDA